MLFWSTRISRGRKYIIAEYESDSNENTELNKRLCKTLYFGRKSNLEQPSLAMTEFPVDVLQDIAPKELGRIDIDWAADMSGELMVPPNAFLVGMIYAKRLQKKQKKYINQISSSDLFLVSMMMASKFLYDEGEEDAVVNNEWAASVNMDVKDLNELERNFLAALDWDLFVSEKEFWTTLHVLEQQLARRKLQECRSLTYTEMLVLSASDVLHQHVCQLLVELCKVVSVCTVAYAASTLLLVASQMTVYSAVTAMMEFSYFQHSALCAVQPVFKCDAVNRLPVLYDHGAIIMPSVVDDIVELGETSVSDREWPCINDASRITLYVQMVLSTIGGVWCSRPRRCPHADQDTPSSALNAILTEENNSYQDPALFGSMGHYESACPILSPAYVLPFMTSPCLVPQNFTEFGVGL